MIYLIFTRAAFIECGFGFYWEGLGEIKWHYSLALTSVNQMLQTMTVQSCYGCLQLTGRVPTLLFVWFIQTLIYSRQL